MQTQDRATTQAVQPPRNSKRITWLISLCIGIALLASIGVTVLAYARTDSNSRTATKTSPSWQRVLNGYSLVSLIAASSNAAVLYACGNAIEVSTSTVGASASYTLLRSNDSGTTWQRVTGNMPNCQFVVNPKGSDDLYVVGPAGHTASNGTVSNVLKHSTDGGRSWTDIAPIIETGNPQLSITWDVQQLTMVGNRLFGIQTIPSANVRPIRPIGKPSPIGIVTRVDLSRLITSSDGGRTWSIVDGNLNATGQETYEYAVSLNDAQTIYELAGVQELPYYHPVIPGNPSTTVSSSLTLYKTTNGGETWTKLRENIPSDSTIQFAHNNTSLVYIGSSAGALSPIGPYAPPTAKSFSLMASKDGGTTWNTIQLPAGAASTRNWFVSANGQIYIAVSSTTTVPPIKPIPGGTTASGKSQVAIGDVTTIQCYDVTRGTWSSVTKTPANGLLLAVTTDTTNHTDTLWILSLTDSTQILYKETLYR